MSGFAVSSHSSMPLRSRAVSPASDWFGRITSTSASIPIPKGSATWRSISLCWPVATTVQWKSPAERNAATTGASFTASGRVPMKIRMLRFAAMQIPRSLLPALPGRRPTEAARDDFKTGEPAEFTVVGEVAPPELARLHHKPPEPLHARHLHPVWRALDEAGEHVEAAADADDDGHPKALAVALDPHLLERRGHADEQHVRAAGADFLDDARMIVRAEIAVMEAGDLDSRVLHQGALHELRDHLLLGTEEIDAQLMLACRSQEARHEIHAGHTLGHRLARGPQCPDHRHAVGQDETARTAGRCQLRVAPHHAQMRGVCRDDRVGVGLLAQFEATRHGRLDGYGVELQAEQLSVLFAPCRSLVVPGVALMAEMRPLIFDANGGGAFARPEAGVLIGTQEAPEFRIVVARQALEPAPEVTPQHGGTADQRRMRRQA